MSASTPTMIDLRLATGGQLLVRAEPLRALIDRGAVPADAVPLAEAAIASALAGTDGLRGFVRTEMERDAASRFAWRKFLRHLWRLVVVQEDRDTTDAPADYELFAVFGTILARDIEVRNELAAATTTEGFQA